MVRRKDAASRLHEDLWMERPRSHAVGQVFPEIGPSPYKVSGIWASSCAAIPGECQAELGHGCQEGDPLRDR